MSVRVQAHKSNPTKRQCFALVNAADELKSTGGFYFRCALAALAMEAKRIAEIYNGGKDHTDTLRAFEEEMRLHATECTTEKDGKKKLDVEAYMVHFEKAKEKYVKDFKKVADLDKVARQALDDTAEIVCNRIPWAMLEETDKEAKFSSMTLSALLPFVEPKP